MSTAIVRLDGAVAAEVSEPPPERLLAGSPQLQVRNFFTDTSQQFFAGRWSATRGKWRVRYTENELCVMTAGRVIIESEAASAAASGPGTRSWFRRALPAPGKWSRTAPRSTRSSKRAARA